ncbi:DUF6339 family protein [Halogranum rubrum]|uniref:DUF6339 family protein n=1 Tax=Halogranum rubrum TaxID=553466 RepID=UPI0012FAB3BD|nr:DUF6339 family protein [Halogranum salarium]
MDEAFVRGDRELTADEIENARQELDFDIEPTQFDVEGLRDKFNAIISDDKVDRAEIDAKMASEVRKHLDLTREQAAHDGMWRYLAVVEFPEFVRHRWPYPDKSSGRSFSAAQDKYLEGARDLYEQALVRLWWIAELTREGDDYSRTRAALEKQELANDVFDRGYARYPPAVRAIVDELKDAKSPVVSKATTKLNHAFSTIRLESLEEEEIKEMVRQIRKQVEGSPTT